MEFETIRLEQSDAAVATLTLDRPERLNALSAAMLGEMRSALALVAESDARCLLLTGAGRGFSSGADLAAAGGLPDDAGLALEQFYNPLIEALFELPMPVVAAVNGPAAGAGCSIALAADIVIAARSAYFLQAFVHVGLVPDAGATWLLPRLAGRARALEMMMLGERIPAEKALEWGMISRVVDDEALVAEAVSVATALAQGPTIALGLIRRLARESGQAPLAAALAAERDAQRQAGQSEDFRQAVFAFLEKRPPAFRGR